MNAHTLNETTGAILNIDIAHRMGPRDFRRLVEEIRKQQDKDEGGPLRLVIQVHELAEDRVVWGDAAADQVPLGNVDRIAILGEKKWEKSMSAFCQPFPVAEVRYFLPGQTTLARNWVAEPRLNPVEPPPNDSSPFD